MCGRGFGPYFWHQLSLDFSDSRRVLDWWPDLFDTDTGRNYTLHFTITCYCPQSRLPCRCLVAASTANVSLPVGSRTVPGLSYQLLTAAAYNDWIAAVLLLTNSPPNWTDCNSQSQYYFATGSLPPISSSWRQAPWDPRPEIVFNWTLAVIGLM
jgi:hypothetical protein